MKLEDIFSVPEQNWIYCRARFLRTPHQMCLANVLKTLSCLKVRRNGIRIHYVKLCHVLTL